MHSTAKGKRLVGFAILLVAAAFATRSEVAGQTVGQYPGGIKTTGPRLEASALHRPTWTKVPAQQIDVSEGYNPNDRGSSGGERERGPLFSSRGALIGAAFGCTLGAVLLYDPKREQVDQRLAWTLAGCIIVSLPSAWVGSLILS